MKEIVYLEWLDSASTNGWVAAEDVNKACGIATCATVGFLVREDEKELVVSRDASTDEQSSPHGQCIAIPKVCLVKRLPIIAND
jgi:hypothetical protein